MAEKPGMNRPKYVKGPKTLSPQKYLWEVASHGQLLFSRGHSVSLRPKLRVPRKKPVARGTCTLTILISTSHLAASRRQNGGGARYDDDVV